MFKAIGDFLNKTPWWALLFAGVTTLALLVMFALPVHVIRLMDSGQNPAENNAIQREIGLAVGDRALTMAQGVVTTMKERSTDAARRDELDHALAEIEHARDELTRAQNNTAADAARDAAASALETARDSAESAVDAAREAREAVEEARSDALDRLRDKGLDISATQRTFDQLLATAHDNERAAIAALAALRALPQSGPSLTPPAPPVPVAPAAPKAPAAPAAPAVPKAPPAPSLLPPPPVPALAISATKHGLILDISDPNGKLLSTLSDERRNDIRSQVGNDVWRVATGSVLILVFIPLFVTLMIVKFFNGRSRRALALADRKTREAEISDVSRQVTEARLQALQAQVEPHFLYNTLANVQALNEVDPPAANQMVGHLIQYLRASLPKMRESTSTVGQELELVRAYLNILQMRMGDRLAFDIRADADLLACAFPPMMLPSLVENAIKHGLEPLREGGRIDVAVERVHTPGGDRLLVQVLDTGKGLTDASVQLGSGVGLSNVRERLSAIYGANARFALLAREPQGVAASIDIPLQSSKDYASALPQGTSVPAVATGLPAAPARKGWRKIWYATSATHSLWVRLLARTFMVLMVLLAGLLVASFIGLLTGWMPVQMGDVQLDGMEGLAIGSVGLLIGFGVTALAVAVVVAVLYGLGFLFAALLVLIPAILLIALFPVLSPFILLGLLMWWVLRRRRV